VEVVHLHTEGPAPYAAPELASHVRHNALFIGTNVRAAVAAGRADYTPVFLSEIPRLFAPGGSLTLDVALIQVTPPDIHGNCSLGVSVDCALAAVREARLVIAQVNPNLPRSRGAVVPEALIDLAVAADDPLPAIPPATISDDARNIARIVAGLVSDGATLQLGIGAIPAAVCSELHGHSHLGVHTEMFTDTVLPLIESGVIDGSQKSRDTGIVVSSFVLGSDSLYRFIDDNPGVELHPVSYTNDVQVIASQRRMVAINSALSVDLTGQVAADSIGPRFYSGIGGQVDFIRGAARSEGGVPIIALPSTAADGSISRIAAQLEAGSGVVTTRGDVHWVVTEYGAANLFGQTIRTRVRKLIELAHPNFREQLEAEAGGLGYLGHPF
jgi:acetyl-CoA hydrolase